jgi:mycothiol synthase
MPLLMHAYQGDDDYWRIRPFLRDVFVLNGRREISWAVMRWDYWRWPGVESWGDGPLEGRVFIWEQPDGRVTAVLNPESRGQAFLQLHPQWRSPELVDEMLAVAEQHLAKAGPDGRQTLGVWVDSHDSLQQDVLRRRGYNVTGEVETQHRWTTAQPIPEAPVAEGFTVRSLGEAGELPARSWSSWKAFHPHAPDTDYIGWAWYLDIQRCPLYRRDLDLVAVAPNGDLASFCTVWYDDVTRSAYFEPVATYPAYLRRGLAKATMAEGLRRVTRLGATVVFVGGYSVEANALYDAVAGPESDHSEQWAKQWP